MIRGEHFRHYSRVLLSSTIEGKLYPMAGISVNISRAAIERNTLIVLPTALGKTMIALFNAVELLAKAPQGEVFDFSPNTSLSYATLSNFYQTLETRNQMLCVFQPTSSDSTCICAE